MTIEQPWPPNNGRCPNGCPEKTIYNGLNGHSIQFHSKSVWCLHCGWARNREGHEEIPA